MQYYTSRRLNTSFDDAVNRMTDALKQEGFGVLTEIDVRETLKKKLDVDVPRYRILGACSPPNAHQALQAEPLIGLMLPCNVVVRDAGDGTVEVAVIDPVASMQAVDNPKLNEIAGMIRDRLRAALERVDR